MFSKDKKINFDRGNAPQWLYAVVGLSASLFCTFMFYLSVSYLLGSPLYILPCVIIFEAYNFFVYRQKARANDKLRVPFALKALWSATAGIGSILHLIYVLLE